MPKCVKGSSICWLLSVTHWCTKSALCVNKKCNTKFFFSKRDCWTRTSLTVMNLFIASHENGVWIPLLGCPVNASSSVDVTLFTVFSASPQEAQICQCNLQCIQLWTAHKLNRCPACNSLCNGFGMSYGECLLNSSFFRTAFILKLGRISIFVHLWVVVCRSHNFAVHCIYIFVWKFRGRL